MMRNLAYWLVALVSFLPLSPLVALAAFNDINSDGSARLELTNDSTVYTLDSSTRVQSITVNASTIEFVVSPGSIISITSSDRKNFSYSNTTCGTVETSCSSESSNLFIQCGSNTTAAETITVTPSGTCTVTTGGSSGGSSGGGGGGGQVTTPAPVKTTPVVVEKPVTPPTKVTNPLQNPVVAPVKVTLPTPAAFQFKKDIKVGSKGEDVKQLQTKLKALGFLPANLVVDGNFGPATTKAVKAFQKANKISQVGTVGPATRSALNKSDSVAPAPAPTSSAPAPVTAPSPTAPSSYQFSKDIKVGSSGDAVKELQIKLKALGYLPASIQPNGNFGPATTKAVKAFQKANKISQVGNIGPATRAALNKN